MSDKEIKEEQEKVKFREKLKIWKKIDLKNPLHMWKLIFFSIVFLLIAFGSTYGVFKATGTNSSCASCHIHPPEVVTHELTTHTELYCTDCHVEPGFDNYIMSKVNGAYKMFLVTTGQTPDPIYMYKAPIPNETCYQCHSPNRRITASGDIIPNHDGHIEAGVLCVTCHSGVAHGKAVERGLVEHKDFDYWTEENGEELISTKYTRPNMGTCIDCHLKYNKGDEPWEDKYYSLSYPPQYESDSFGILEVFDLIEKQLENPQEGQISMACETCHTEIVVPDSHNNDDFGIAHGEYALNKLDTCVDCHDQAKWQKDIQAVSMTRLLHLQQPNMDHYVPDIYVVQFMAKETLFCFTCHEVRPDSHQTIDIWLTGHAQEVASKQDVNNCLTCHNMDIAEEIDDEILRELKIIPPTDVYCATCHRTGLAVE